jgi:SAM-dependent methyltransferase
MEGFTQRQPFLVKTDVYDDFYSKIYHSLHRPENRIDFEWKTIVETTQPSVEYSSFLEVGPGTGALMSKLTKAGYHTEGIDQSEAMVKTAREKHPNLEIKCGDVNNSMTYVRNTFTHILCFDMTYYEISDKNTFLRNCYSWLVPNGYLMITLVDPQKYNPIIAASIPSMVDNPQKYSRERLTESKINFPGFEYRHSTEFEKLINENRVVVKETFTDSTTKHVRQNELTLWMDATLEKTLQYILGHGFVLQSQVQMWNDEFKFLYIFERV